MACYNPWGYKIAHDDADDSSIQIPLLKPQLLEPLPIDESALRGRLAEQDGRAGCPLHVSATTWERLTPLIEVVGPKTPKPPLTRTSVAAWVKRVADAVGTHPFYLDILRLDPSMPVAVKDGEEPVLGRMYAEARKRRMRFVPVVHVGESTNQHRQLVSEAALEDGNGVALRYRMRTVTPSAGLGHDDVLRTHLSDLGVAVEEADLLSTSNTWTRTWRSTPRTSRRVCVRCARSASGDRWW